MKRLPVPPLSQTLERYLDIVRPLLDDDEFATTSRVTAEFGEGEGRRCQEALEHRASEADEGDTNWLTETWLRGYLAVRGPLPLTSNVGFEITWTSPLRGLDRAADVLYRFASVHLSSLRGELPALISPRGAPLCSRQTVYRAGGMRHPAEEVDEVRPGPTTAATREVVIVHRRRGFAVTVSDEEGMPLPRARLRAALASLLACADDDAPPVSAWSPLGSESAVEHQREAFADPHNVEVYERLCDGLFVLSIMDEPAEATEHLFRDTFDPDLTWFYKPVTYVVNLADEHMAMHIEHTTVDGGTLNTTVQAAQELPEEDRTEETTLGTDDTGTGDTETDDSATGETPTAELAALAPLQWRLTEDHRTRLSAEVEEYRQRAAGLEVTIVEVPAVRARKVSHDACMQVILLTAQLSAYGRIRSVYEAVDMREFQAGRTETMRPVSTEAVALAQGLLDGTATTEQLQEAFAVHRQRIIWCKTGQGINRHLLGLSVEAERLGLTPAFFTDPGYTRLITDFVSTSSLGGKAQISRYAFAPTSAGGIGVGYNPIVEGEEVVEYDFVVTHAPADVEIDGFLAALPEAAAALAALVADSEAHPTS